MIPTGIVSPIASSAAASVSLCILHGVIKADKVNLLESRLRAIAEQCEAPLSYHEIAYKIPAAPGGSPVELRLRCDLKGNYAANSSSREWTAQYYGPQTETRVTVRPLIEMQVSSNIAAFVELMGANFEFEFIREGVLWRTHRNILIAVSQAKKLSIIGDVRSATLLDSSFWIVEATLLCADDKVADASNELFALADQLVPFVELTKLDFRAAYAANAAVMIRIAANNKVPAVPAVTMTSSQALLKAQQSAAATKIAQQ